MGIIHGILIITLIGRIILEGMSSRTGRRSGSGRTAAFALGASLIVVGNIGVFFGKLIKSAVSRQREFLADASAVRFTRNPSGLRGALLKIAGFKDGSRIHNSRAEEASLAPERLAESVGSSRAEHLFYAERLLADLPPLIGEASEVLSILAREGSRTPAAAEEAFRKGIEVLEPAKASGRVLPREKCSLKLLDAALQRLSEASYPIKEALLKACVLCIGADARISLNEAELLRAVADTLDYPVPPILPGVLDS